MINFERAGIYRAHQAKQHWLMMVFVGVTFGNLQRVEAFELVTADEYQAQLSNTNMTFEGASPPESDSPSSQDKVVGPVVDIITPDPQQPVQAPMNIEIRFRTSVGSEVDVATFRVLYGLLKLDVTKKLLSAPGVQVSSKGINVSGADLPKGRHKFVIEIADRAGRIGRRILEVQIV